MVHHGGPGIQHMGKSSPWQHEYFICLKCRVLAKVNNLSSLSLSLSLTWVNYQDLTVLYIFLVYYYVEGRKIHS